MVSVSMFDKDCHNECCCVFEEAVHSVKSGDESIVLLINKSGYTVSTSEEVVDLIEDFQEKYLEAHHAVNRNL